MLAGCISRRIAVAAIALLALAPVDPLVRVASAVIAGYSTASIPLAFSLGVAISAEPWGVQGSGSTGWLPLDMLHYALMALPVAAAAASLARFRLGPLYRLEGFALPAAALGALLGGYNSCLDIVRPVLAVVAAASLPGILQLLSLPAAYSWHGLALVSLLASLAPFKVEAPLPLSRAAAGIPGRWPPALLAVGPLLGGDGLACAVSEPRPPQRMLVVADTVEPWVLVRCLGLKPDTIICPACQWMEWEKATGLPVRLEEPTSRGIILYEGVFPADIALASPPPEGGAVVVVDLTSSPPPAGGWRLVLSYVSRMNAPIVMVAKSGPSQETPAVGGRLPVQVYTEEHPRLSRGRSASLVVIAYRGSRLYVTCRG